jgi:hypothetical protein
MALVWALAAKAPKTIRIMLLGGIQFTGGTASDEAVPQEPSTETAAAIGVSQTMVERPRAVSLRQLRMTLWPERRRRCPPGSPLSRSRSRRSR